MGSLPAEAGGLKAAARAGRLERIYVAPRAGAPMQRRPVVEALTGGGLAGDRYQLGTGYYCPRDACPVTFIEQGVLEAIRARFGVAVLEGQHRRNLVVSGLTHEEVRGAEFCLGEVRFRYLKPRPPCGYLQRLTEPGLTRALGEGPGWAAEILQGGWLREGDAFRLESRPERRRWLP